MKRSRRRSLACRSALLNFPSGNSSLNYPFAVETSVSVRESERVSFRTNSSYRSEQISRRARSKHYGTKPRTILSTVGQHFATSIAMIICERNRNRTQISKSPPRLARGSKSCLRSSCQNARRFFFAARAARVMFPRCACRTELRKSCSNCQTTRDFIV